MDKIIIVFLTLSFVVPFILTLVFIIKNLKPQKHGVKRIPWTVRLQISKCQQLVSKVRLVMHDGSIRFPDQFIYTEDGKDCIFNFKQHANDSWYDLLISHWHIKEAKDWIFEFNLSPNERWHDLLINHCDTEQLNKLPLEITACIVPKDIGMPAKCIPIPVDLRDGFLENRKSRTRISLVTLFGLGERLRPDRNQKMEIKFSVGGRRATTVVIKHV